MEKSNSLEDRIEGQKRLIHKQVDRIKELMVWEKFASHLVNNCLGQTISEENLEKWLAEANSQKTRQYCLGSSDS